MPPHTRLDAVQQAGTACLDTHEAGRALSRALKPLVARATSGNPVVLSFAGAATIRAAFLAAAVSQFHMAPDFNPLCLSVVDIPEDRRRLLQRLNAQAIHHRGQPEAYAKVLAAICAADDRQEL